MPKLKVRASLLWVLFITVLAAFMFLSIETAWADDQQRVAPTQGFITSVDGSIPYDGTAIAGVDHMCSLQAYTTGDPIEMTDANTVFLPPPVCEAIVSYLLIQLSTGELIQQPNTE